MSDENTADPIKLVSYGVNDSLKELEERESLVSDLHSKFKSEVARNTTRRLQRIGKQKVHVRIARLAQYYIAGTVEGTIGDPRPCIVRASRLLGNLHLNYHLKSKRLDDLASSVQSEKLYAVVDDIMERYGSMFQAKYDSFLTMKETEECWIGIGMRKFVAIMDCLLFVSKENHSGSDAPNEFIQRALDELESRDSFKMSSMLDSGSHHPYEAFLMSQFSLRRNKHLQQSEYRLLCEAVCRNAELVAEFERAQLVRAEHFFLPLMIETTESIRKRLEELWDMSLKSHGLQERGEKAGGLTDTQERDIAAYFLLKCLKQRPELVIDTLKIRFPHAPYKNVKHLRSRINRKATNSSDSGVENWIDDCSLGDLNSSLYPDEQLQTVLRKKLYLVNLGLDST